VIQRNGWEYDSFKNIFINKRNPNIRKILDLTPEKYFRNPKIDELSFEEFSKENEILMNELKKIFEV